VISEAAKQTGLDVAKLKVDFDGPAQDLFKADLELARKMGVRGFPTMFFVDSNEQRQVVYGFKPYQEFENTMIKTFANATKNNYDKNWQSIFNKYNTLTTREFAELSNINKKEAESLLTGLVKEGKLQKQNSKNGPLWLLPKLIK
jgi:thioredoxin-related protein